jgi:hypothetical protein
VSERTGSPGVGARWAYRLVLLGAFALMLRLNLPGHLSVDSVLALHEGRFHVRETWNPAIFGWLLGVFDSVTPGAAAAVVASGIVLFGAWALVASLRPRTSWLAPLFALAFAVTPQVLIYPAIVWKDVWFAEAAIAGFVVLALSLQGRSPAARWGFLALSAVLLAVAGLLRQNGLILVAPAAIAIAWAGWSRGAVRSLAVAGVWVGAVAAGTLALSAYAQPQGPGKPDSAGARGMRLLQAYDLVGATVRLPLPLKRVDRVDPWVDDYIRQAAPRVYSPERVDTLTGDKLLSQAIGRIKDATIRAEWLDLLAEHPGVYLKTRTEVFRWVLETPVIDRCLPVQVGVEGPAKTLADLKMAPRRTAHDARLFNYVTWFFDTPAYSHVTYALIALAVGILLLFRRDPADLAIAALMAGALGFAASFFVISIACDYRYLYLVDVAAMTGVLYLALDPRLRRAQAR